MTDDYMKLLAETADRFRLAAEQANSANEIPQTMKRPGATPAGPSPRSIKAKNAYQRIQAKKGRP